MLIYQFQNGCSSDRRDIPKGISREARILQRLSLDPDHQEALGPVLVQCLRHVQPLSAEARLISQVCEEAETWLRLPVGVRQDASQHWHQDPAALRALMELRDKLRTVAQADAATHAGHELFWSLIRFHRWYGFENTYLWAATALFQAGRGPSELEPVLTSVFPKELREAQPRYKLNVTLREQAEILSRIDESGPVYGQKESFHAMIEVLGWENCRPVIDDVDYDLQPLVELRVCGFHMPHRIFGCYPEERFDTTLPDQILPGTPITEGGAGTYCRDGWAWV